jgi:hypothetical protein
MGNRRASGTGIWPGQPLHHAGGLHCDRFARDFGPRHVAAAEGLVWHASGGGQPARRAHRHGDHGECRSALSLGRSFDARRPRCGKTVRTDEARLPAVRAAMIKTGNLDRFTRRFPSARAEGNITCAPGSRSAAHTKYRFRSVLI